MNGETSAPMDLLLSHSGWYSVGYQGDVLHPERSDVLDAFLPDWTELKRDIKEGGSGLWITSASGGRPGLLDLSKSALTPSFLSFLFFDEDWLGFYFACLIKLVIAGFGTFLFLRQFINTPLALFGGTIFAISGFHAAWFYWPHVATSAWIPWVLWSISGWNFHLKTRWLLLIVFTTSMLILGGFPSVAAYGLYSATILAILTPLILKLPKSDAIKSILSTFIAIGIAFLLTAAPLFSLNEALSQFDLNYRQGGTPYLLAKDWRLLFNPNLYGLPKVEKTLYTGSIAFVLAIAAFILFVTCQIKEKKHRLLVVFGLVLFIISFTISFGLLPSNLIRSIPAIGTSLWSRTVVIFGLSIALLAPLTLQLIVLRCKDLRSLTLSRIFYCFILFLIAFQLIDQVKLFRKFNTIITKEQFLPSTPTIAHIQKDLGDLQSVIADSSYMISGTLGSYGISEWFAHGFKTNAEKIQLKKLVNDPFRSRTAAAFKGASIQLDSLLLNNLGVAYLLINQDQFTLKSIRKQGFGGHKPAPPLPANHLSQIININEQISISSVSLVLATYQAKKAPSDVRVTIIDSEGKIVVESLVNAEDVSDNKATIFSFGKSVLLKTGRYELKLELVGEKNCGKLTVWYVEKPKNYGDTIKINGKTLSGAMLYNFLGYSDYDSKRWGINKLEPNVLVLKNKDAPKGAYFVSDLNEEKWSDKQIHTIRLASDKIQIIYLGDASGYLVLPIRNFPGWQAFINGEEQSIVEYLGILPAVYVTGSSVLEFNYNPEWLNKSITLMLSGLALLIILIFALKQSNKLSRTRQ